MFGNRVTLPATAEYYVAYIAMQRRKYAHAIARDIRQSVAHCARFSHKRVPIKTEYTTHWQQCRILIRGHARTVYVTSVTRITAVFTTSTSAVRNIRARNASTWLQRYSMHPVIPPSFP